MKKVFLSLAAVAVLTVVSCKKADANADDANAVVDSAAATATEAAAEVKK
jgi:Tfp pilus assembly protein PilN